MIELPESRTLARQMNDTLRGRRIAMVEAAKSPHGFAFYSGDPAEYPAKLEGKIIWEVRAFGGWVELQVEDLCLTFHDGVNPRFLAAGAKLPAKHQLHLEFEDGAHLVCTIQMYGGMHLVPAGAHDNFYYVVSRDKPSPLSDDFNFDYFIEIVRSAKANLSVKALLATEQRIPGLGNGCLQDILFDARLNPRVKLSDLSEKDFRRLFDSVRSILASMTQGGGRDTEKDLYGNPGGYHTILSSKTYAYGCPVCSGSIQRKAYLGGNVYFCSNCQPIA